MNSNKNSILNIENFYSPDIEQKQKHFTLTVILKTSSLSNMLQTN